MEARLAQGSLLKRSFEALKDMVTDVNLECSSDGIRLQAMDASHVSLAALCLKPELFESYQCPRNRTLGLSMASVSKVFKLCGNDDALVIKHEDDSDTVVFIFDSKAEDRVGDFHLKLMQIDQEHLGIPETTFAANVTMPSKQFQKMIADLSVFSDTISIEITPKALKFSVKGESGDGSVVLKQNSSAEGQLDIKTEEHVVLSFATRYLQMFTKATSLSDQMILRLSPQHPLNVTYPFQGDPNLGYLRFFLAPKMDDDMNAD